MNDSQRFIEFHRQRHADDAAREDAQSVQRRARVRPIERDAAVARFHAFHQARHAEDAAREA